MSRGIGDFQRAVLTVIADNAPRAVPTTLIADLTFSADNQTRRALHSLARDGHVTAWQPRDWPWSVIDGWQGHAWSLPTSDRPKIMPRPPRSKCGDNSSVRGRSEQAIRMGWR